MLSIKHINVISLVDTGAARTLLRRDIFLKICNNTERIPLLKQTSTRLQSVTGEKLVILGETEVQVDQAGPIKLLVVEDMQDPMILGIDSLLLGKANLNLHHNTMSWHGKIWSLQSNESGGLAGLSHTCPLTDIPALDNVLLAYSDVFSGPNDPNGFYNKNPFRIITEGPPIYQQAYRAPITKRNEISKAIDEMLAEGIIKPSCSPWASPVTLVPKPDKSLRFCVDFRRLNAITKRDRYPLANIHEIFDLLEGSTVFSTLDLKSSYHQMAVHPDDTEKTAFICHRGQFEFLRVPFGLANAPSFFQRTVEHIFRDLLGICVLIYIDDIIVFSPDRDSHIKHFKLVLDCLRKANLKLKPSKCVFGQSQVKILGYIIQASGIKPDPSETEAIRNLKTPTNTKEVRAFLGMCNYYRNCILNFSYHVASLTQLTRKKQKFSWNNQHKAAFETLQAALVSPNILAFPRVDLPYRLYTDASDHAVGAILVQCHEDGIQNVERVVQYHSQQLNDIQRRWSTIEQEAFAIISAVTKLRPYLYGAEFTIFTDHKPLLSLFDKKILNAKLQRWALTLSEYGATIKYHAGKNNIRADFLSRPPCQDIAVFDVDHEWVDPQAFPDEVTFQQLPCLVDNIDLDELVRVQQNEFADQINSAKRDEDSDYIFIHHVLYSTLRPTPVAAVYPRLVLPEKYRKKVIQRAHTEVGHMATLKTLNRIREAYFWPAMRKHVRAELLRCPTCIVNSRQRDKPVMGTMPMPVTPMQMISMDLVGPFVPSSKGNKYILTIIDHFSGWAEAYPLPNKTSDSVWQAFSNYFLPAHGTPEVLLTDNGCEFTAKVFSDYLKTLGIDLRRSTPQNPRCNGKIERFNRSFKDILTKLVQNVPGSWEDRIADALTA